MLDGPIRFDLARTNKKPIWKKEMSVAVMFMKAVTSLPFLNTSCRYPMFFRSPEPIGNRDRPPPSIQESRDINMYLTEVIRDGNTSVNIIAMWKIDYMNVFTTIFDRYFRLIEMRIEFTTAFSRQNIAST